MLLLQYTLIYNRTVLIHETSLHKSASLFLFDIWELLKVVFFVFVWCCLACPGLSIPVINWHRIPWLWVLDQVHIWFSSVILIWWENSMWYLWLVIRHSPRPWFQMTKAVLILKLWPSPPYRNIYSRFATRTSDILIWSIYMCG